jgi:hypothetical protein
LVNCRPPLSISDQYSDAVVLRTIHPIEIFVG